MKIQNKFPESWTGCLRQLMLLFCPTCANILECEEVFGNHLYHVHSLWPKYGWTSFLIVSTWSTLFPLNLLLRHRAPVIDLPVLLVHTCTTSQSASQTGSCKCISLLLDFLGQTSIFLAVGCPEERFWSEPMVNELLGGATRSWRRWTTCLVERPLGRTLIVVTKRWI